MANDYKLAKPVHANRGIEAKYRKKLEQLIAEMAGSCEYWLTAGYKKHPPRIAQEIAQDSASTRMQAIMAELSKRWIEKFNVMADEIAKNYVSGIFNTSSKSLEQSLKDAGWSVKFNMTPAVRDAFNASLQENIGLIKSIPQQYLSKVEGAVMRSYSAGRDLHTMVKDIKEIYPITNKRAAFIARDQSNKANAVVNRARQLELGITDAIWLHSHAGKNPRESHVKAGKDKRRYKIAEGCLIDGEYIQPGELINCRCVSRIILPIKGN